MVAGILRWNFPFFLIARKMAPALVTGNTIVIKSIEETPLNAFDFTELLAECDLPKGVFNLVTGGRENAALQSAHKGVGLISFTGSIGTGMKIMETASRNLTRENLELGGKAPAIILDDCDLDLTANALSNSRVQEQHRRHRRHRRRRRQARQVRIHGDPGGLHADAVSGRAGATRPNHLLGAAMGRGLTRALAGLDPQSSLHLLADCGHRFSGARLRVDVELLKPPHR